MVTIVFTAVVLAVTVLAFWRPRMLMHFVGIIAWLIWSFFMANQVYPEGNDYLWIAVTVFGLSMTLVMVYMWTREYFGTRIHSPSSSDIQAEHKRKVLELTQPRPTKHWWDE